MPGRCARFWAHVLDLGLTLWVLRAPVVASLFGFAILGLAPQAQDLLVDVAAGPWWYIILFLLAVFFVWAIPTHYASRLLVNTDARFLSRVRRRRTAFIGGLKTHAPRILGGLTFVAMLIAVWRSWSNVPGVHPESMSADATRSLKLLAVIIICVFIAYCVYVVTRKRLAGWPVFVALEARVARFVAPIADRLPRALVLGRPAPGVEGVKSNVGPLYLALMFILFTFIPFFAPFTFAEWFPRAIAVPFVLGGWTPLAAYASALGRHLRVPIISLAIIGVSLLTFVFGDNYAVRRIEVAERVASLRKAPKAPSDPLTTRMKLTEAVDLWKRANGCQTYTADCPRPIIIAASGGASRAGFFTASVIGKLLDSGPVQSGGRRLGAEDVRNRLFAISSVSGSSVGAVMTVAALAAAEGQKHPCRGGPFWLWHGTSVSDWRSCLEVLMSGDFLTPVFAGLVFRDTLRFLGVFGKAGSILGWSDRATLIEQSWEAQFADAIPGKPRASKQRQCVGSLECPFVSLRATREGDTVHWLPLLLLNGASVSTGQRIVTSTLDPWYRPGDCPLALDGNDPNKCPVFHDAYDFHLLLDGEQKASGTIAAFRGIVSLDAGSSVNLTDVRLSTAAHNSARFPLISPPGEVRNRANNVLDRIVDGGYFENFGAQTAVELARAMQAVDNRLAPFILILSNDPGIPRDDKFTVPDASEGEFLTDLSGPVNTILNTRAARGTLAVDNVATALDEALTPACVPNAAHIRVWPEFVDAEKKDIRPLSFSWWLSKPVQRRLHEQTEFEEGNRVPLASVIKALMPKPPSGCAGRTQAAPSSRKDKGVVPRQRP